MADFRPGGQGRFGAFLRPQCRSRGVPTHFARQSTQPFSGLCSYPPPRHIGLRIVTFRPRVPGSRLIYTIPPEKSTVRPMQNGSVLQDCKKPPQRRGVLVLPEKRMYNQGQWDRARKPRDAPRESLSASVKEAKEEHCHGNFARDQPGAGGSGVLRLPGQRPYPGPAGGALTGPGRPEGGALPSGQRRPAGAAAGPGHGGFRPGRDPAASVRRHQGLFLQHHRIL